MLDKWKVFPAMILGTSCSRDLYEGYQVDEIRSGDILQANEGEIMCLGTRACFFTSAF